MEGLLPRRRSGPAGLRVLAAVHSRLCLVPVTPLGNRPDSASQDGAEEIGVNFFTLSTHVLAKRLFETWSSQAETQGCVHRSGPRHTSRGLDKSFIRWDPPGIRVNGSE